MAAALSPFQLNGVFLVTGGTRGIGRAISHGFATAGAHVIANYLRNDTAARDLQAAARLSGLQIDLLRADLTHPQGLQQIAEHVSRLAMPLRGVVHCAATGTHRGIDSLSGRHLDATFALNVRALYELAKVLLPAMTRGASVLAISSLGATHALPQYTAVGVSKGALNSLIRHLAVELAPRGIRSNILTPGAVATDAWNAIPDAEARLDEAARRSPLERLVTVEEIALSAQFLCSTAASGINGQTLVVDGGVSIVA